MDLAGRVAVVTGGGRRLGRAMAVALGARGMRVVVHYGTSSTEAEATAAAIRAGGGEALVVQADLADEGAVRRLIPAAVERFGRVDVLVNSAAIFEPGGVADTTSAAWDRHFAINLKAPFLLSQTFAAHLAPDATGKIVNVSDWRGCRPDATYLAYTLTKAALMTLTQALAVALAPRVQVNCLALGAILLPAGADATYRERLLAQIPARRLGTPDDVVRALLFLLEHDYLTGEVLLVDGGRHLV